MRNNTRTLTVNSLIMCLILGFLLVGQSAEARQKKSTKTVVTKTKKIVSIALEPIKKTRNKPKTVASKKNKKSINSKLAEDVEVEPLSPRQQAKLTKERAHLAKQNRARKKSRRVASEDSLNKIGMAMPDKIHNPLDDQKSASVKFTPQKPPSLKKLVKQYEKTFDDDLAYDESDISSTDLAISQ